MPLRKMPSQRQPFLNMSIYDFFGSKPHDRRMKLLRMATPRSTEHRTHHGLPIHCDGGIALKHPDLKWLLRKGYVATTRVTYGAGWALDVNHPAPLRRSYAVITDMGREALERGKL